MTLTTLPGSDAQGRIAACVAGAGPALVLIHGVGLRAQAWEPLVSVLGGFTVHAIDMPGHGRSPLDGTAGLQDYVDRIACYVDRIDGPAFLTGHSMGAMIALELARQRPAQTSGVAALNAVFRRSASAAAAVRARADAFPEDGVPDPAPTLERWFGVSPSGAAARAKEACRDWLTQADPQGYRTAYRTFAAHDGPPAAALAGLNCPALFLTGELDPNSTPAMSAAMAAAAPSGRSEVFAGAAHMLPMTHALQTARSLCAAFEHGSVLQ